MRFDVQNGGPSSDSPRLRSPSPTRPKSRVGAAIAFVFTVFAFVVVACSGDSGVSSADEQGRVDEQGQRICNQDEGCEPPPRDPCGHDGEACCRINNSCQAGLICFQGGCTQCGVPGGPCCAPGNTCQAGSACQSGACVRTCGGQGLACCASGPQCDGGLACSGGTCQLCGNNGQTCCPGNTCNGGRQCIGGTCRVCGGNGQACCTSGPACGINMGCQSGTCRPLCGTVFGTCCPGFDWQKCPFAGPGYACDQGINRCEPCGNTGDPCCTTGSACTFQNVCRQDPFGFGTSCQRCGTRGQPCCGNSCTTGVCQSGTCQ